MTSYCYYEDSWPGGHPEAPGLHRELLSSAHEAVNTGPSAPKIPFFSLYHTYPLLRKTQVTGDFWANTGEFLSEWGLQAESL